MGATRHLGRLIERLPFIKQDAKDGRPLEMITLSKGVDPDPHGMDIHEGYMYYCDAGISPPGIESGSAASGYICRLTLG